MRLLLPLFLLAAAPAFSAPAPKNVRLIAAGLQVLGPRLALTGSPSLIALSVVDLAAPSSERRLATMARALPDTDRELLRGMLEAQPAPLNDIAWLMLRAAQGAERYANSTEQRLTAALARGDISAADAKRELRVAESLMDSPHLSDSANARVRAARETLSALARKANGFDGR